MGRTFYFDWELSLMEWLQSFESKVLNILAQFFSMFGEELLLIAVLGFIYWCFDKEKGKRVAMAFLAAFAWSSLVKGAALRRRPYADHDSIRCLRPPHPEGDLADPKVQGFSCPSMHASMSVSIFGSIGTMAKSKPVRAVCALLPVFVGVSRLYVGVHYPTDVLLGWLLGLAAMLIVSLLFSRIRNRKIVYGAFVLSVLPGLFYCRDVEYFSALGLVVGFSAAFLFEDRFVNFENTRSPVKSIIRLVGGAAVFFAVSSLIKLPFPKDMRESASAAAFALRSVRYAVSVFCAMALYPMLFKKLRF